MEADYTLTRAQFLWLALPLLAIAGGITLAAVLVDPAFWTQSRWAPRLFAEGAVIALGVWLVCLIRTLRFTPRVPSGS